MNKKIVLGTLIIIAVIFAYCMFTKGVFGLPSFSELESQKSAYETKNDEITVQRKTFDKNKNELVAVLNNYKENKDSYESMARVSGEDSKKTAARGDYFDLEYLWTILGGYGSKEKVKLGLVCTTSSKISDSKDYIYANLNFTVVGEYKPISEFIEDCEKNDDLGFRISAFKLGKYERTVEDDADEVANYLQASFTVKDVPLSASTLELINNQVEDSAELQNNLSE